MRKRSGWNVPTKSVKPPDILAMKGKTWQATIEGVLFRRVRRRTGVGERHAK